MVRLFYGIAVEAPWPEVFPKGRVLDPSHRHATLAFLGECSTLPDPAEPPPFKIGKTGYFDKCSCFSHVMAWEMQWWDSEMIEFQKNFREKREWKPHVTLCREPFDLKEWKKSFKPLPFFISSFNLYESLGYSRYKALWSYPFIPPFEEFEHTADVAFFIRGENVQEIYMNAFTALSFQAPQCLSFIPENKAETIEEVVVGLNEVISKVDAAFGSPFKAVSYHGDIEAEKEGLIWEMIVDV